MSIWVLGSVEVVAAFALGGLEGRVVKDRLGLREILSELTAREEVRIVAIEEDTAELLREEVDRMKLDPQGPLVVEIPGIRGAAEGRRTALDMVRKALGIRL